MNRKDFIKTASLASILAMTGLTLQSCSSDSEDTDPNPNDPNDPNGGGQANTVQFSIANSPFTALQNDQGWLLHPQEDILLINVGGTISAFTSVCTHSGCARDWTFPNQLFTCNCHGSQFDSNGAVVTGPASSPLARLNLTRNGNDITITI